MIIFVGGDGYYNDVWAFDRNSKRWNQLPDMPEYREIPQAGVVTYADGSKHLVIAGGRNDGTSTILNLDTMTYRPGPDIPNVLELYYANSVPFGNTFLMVGGTEDGISSRLNTIYEFDTTNENWIVRPETLKTGDWAMTAFMVPDTYVQCS